MKINIFDVVSILICNAVISNTNPLSMLRPGNKAFFPEKAELTLLSILQFELPEWFRNNKLRIGLHWELQRFTKFCISNTCLILNERQSTFRPNKIRFNPKQYVTNTTNLRVAMEKYLLEFKTI